jgi:hypothetical protein
MVFVVRAL